MAAGDDRQARSVKHRCAEPVTQQQGDLDIGSIVGYRSAAALHRALDAIFHRVEVQMEFLGSGGITRTSAQVHQQCFAKPFVTVRLGCQRAEYVADPRRCRVEVAAQQGRHRQARIAGEGDAAARTRAGCDRDIARILRLPM